MALFTSAKTGSVHQKVISESNELRASFTFSKRFTFVKKQQQVNHAQRRETAKSYFGVGLLPLLLSFYKSWGFYIGHSFGHVTRSSFSYFFIFHWPFYLRKNLSLVELLFINPWFVDKTELTAGSNPFSIITTPPFAFAVSRLSALSNAPLDPLIWDFIFKKARHQSISTIILDWIHNRWSWLNQKWWILKVIMKYYNEIIYTLVKSLN